MYVVTNRIDFKAGYAKKMAPMFTKNSGIKEMKGFVRTEVWQIDNEESYDQLYVNTWWDTEEDFKAWRNSDAFKNAHSGPKKSGESPVLNNEVVKAHVLTQLD
ncbi:heme oxygenase [Staphylococcus pettenkoferi]|uniref:heme oxygenase n=1 Tax=Staphylococcus pettenkoferi TaxID=170573 RepID=UPI000B51B71E|nr:heme oxygenase [Staphylococcus pettenkoferi]ASE36635.1 heme oxygenase [Staphylococcus pettenkoferi]